MKILNLTELRLFSCNICTILILRHHILQDTHISPLLLTTAVQFYRSHLNNVLDLLFIYASGIILIERLIQKYFLFLTINVFLSQCTHVVAHRFIVNVTVKAKGHSQYQCSLYVKLYNTQQLQNNQPLILS